jgi:hypothetical protein
MKGKIKLSAYSVVKSDGSFALLGRWRWNSCLFGLLGLGGCCSSLIVQACESHVVRRGIGQSLRKPITLRTPGGAIIKVPILVRFGHDSKGDLFHMASDMSAKLMWNRLLTQRTSWHNNGFGNAKTF